MQRREMLAIVNKDTPLLRPDQEMSGRCRKDRGDRAGFGVLRPNLTETVAVEGQQSFLRCGYHELRFLAVCQQCRSKSYERRRWQVPARNELPGGSTTKVVFQKAARPAYIKMVLKTRRLQKDGGRANQLESGSHRPRE